MDKARGLTMWRGVLGDAHVAAGAWRATESRSQSPTAPATRAWR